MGLRLCSTQLWNIGNYSPNQDDINEHLYQRQATQKEQLDHKARDSEYAPLYVCMCGSLRCVVYGIKHASQARSSWILNSSQINIITAAILFLASKNFHRGCQGGTRLILTKDTPKYKNQP